MDTTNLHPNVWGIPHEVWRPRQYESMKWVREQAGITLLEAPVGSGKTAIATAAGHNRRSLSIVRTKFLQDQYGSDYAWNIVKGRDNYPCIHYDNPSGSTAKYCLCPNNMDSCEFADECAYHQAKMKALSSRKVNCNYQLWLTSKYLRDWKAHFTILDECHDLPKIVLEWVGCEVNLSDKRTFELPDFPNIEGDRGSLLGVVDSTSDALTWLRQCRTSLDDLRRKVQASSRSDKKDFLERIDKFDMKLGATTAGLERFKFDWYIKSGPKALSNGEAGFIAKPLTARHHFKSLFCNQGDMMLMSATIGNMGVFASELGIDEYNDMSVESNWKPEVRPVHVLDAPKMGVGAVAKNPKAFDQQAETISKFIKQYPDDWHGLILVTRRSEAQELTTRLSRNGLGYRIWPFPLTSTDDQLAAWEVQKRKHKGQIGITWSMWEGLSAEQEKLLVVAKCLTEDMKLFGPNGYIDLDSARIGDKVFSITKDGEFIVDSISQVYSQPYEGEIITFKGKGYDMSVTPNHDMLLHKPRQGGYNKGIWPARKLEAQCVKGSAFIVIHAKSWHGKTLPPEIDLLPWCDGTERIWYKPNTYVMHQTSRTMPSAFRRDCHHFAFSARLSDVPKDFAFKGDVYISRKTRGSKVKSSLNSTLFVKLMAWYITEGCIHGDSIAIVQNEGEKFREIVDIVTGLGLKHHICYRKVFGGKQRVIEIACSFLSDIFSAECGVGSYNKKVPQFILDSDKETIRMFIDELMKGDGSRGVYYTASTRLSLDVVELATKAGYKATIAKKRNCWQVTISKHRHHGTMKSHNKTTTDYCGKVWCVQTCSGNIMVSRNGQFCFVGNCPFPQLGPNGSYERERMMYDPNFYRLTTATLIEQGCGRIRRGRPEDYDVDGVSKAVAIADGDLPQVKKYLSKSFTESLVNE